MTHKQLLKMIKYRRHVMKGKIFAAITAAVITAASMGGGAAAQTTDAQYTESYTEFAEELHKEVSPRALFAGPNGTVDYFITRDNKITFHEPPPMWFHSNDGGKSWKTMDMTWSYPDPNTIPEGSEYIDFYVTDSGDVYFIKEAGGKTVKRGNSVIGFPKHKLYKQVNGKAQEIPNIELANPDYVFYEIAGIDDNGDITIAEQITTSTHSNLYFYTYDVRSGELKKKAKGPNGNFIFRCYGNGIAYGIDYFTNAPTWTLEAYNTSDGSQVFCIPFPGPGGEAHNAAETLCAKKDGTLYITSKNGLFRMDVGSTTPVKLLDASNTILDRKDAFCRDSSISEDGTIYIPVYFDTPTGSGKLYRFSPA